MQSCPDDPVARDPITSLTWRNASPGSCDRILSMMTVPNAASSIIRVLLAVLLAVAVIGPMPGAAAKDWAADGVHSIQGTSSHDCCDPGPAAPDGSCTLVCAQARCGWTAIPAMTSLPAPDRQAIRWEIVSVLPDDISPETATPPPRA